MLAYLPLIQQILLEYLTKKPGKHGVSINLTGLGLMALSGLMGFLVLVFLLLAFESYAESIYGEPKAWLLTAAITFVLTSIICLMAHISKRRKGLVHKVKEEVQDHLTPVAQFIEELANPVKDHPLAAVILAGLAGLMAGEKLNRNGTED